MDEKEKTAAENETEVKTDEAEERSAEEPAKTEDKNAAKSTEKPAEKTFTQKEMDEIISERLGRERKKSEKVSGEAEKTAKENAELKNSLACYKAGVKEDCIEDTVVLAGRLVDGRTDFETALKKVLEKHPSFVSGVAVTTGVRTENKSYSQSDDKLRAAFGLKPKN